VDDEPFVTLAGDGEAELRVRGSRFLAVAFPAGSEGDARDVLEGREREHFAARHHCAAWRFRDGSWRALDAGEPSGSAGAPILAALDSGSLVDAGIVVTRYFGGTKLGVGGLARAYGQAAVAAIEGAPRRRGIPALRLEIVFPYEHTSAVMRLLDRFPVRAVEHGFVPGGTRARARLAIPRGEAPGLAHELREMTAGAVEPREVDDLVLYHPFP
jgi:putative IMPACT (imprinted ancient) family translation regulator